MAPIDINNQDINSITLNGNTDVDTVTVNGQEVFSSGPTVVTSFSDSFENGLTNWQNVGSGPDCSVSSSFATDGSFSLQGNGSGSSAPAVVTDTVLFSGNKFILEFDFRLTQYEDFNGFQAGLLSNDGTGGGDLPRLRWVYSERSNYSRLQLDDGSSSVITDIGFYPNLNQTYSARLEYINDSLELFINNSSVGTSSSNSISFNNLSIYFRFAEIDGFVDDVSINILQ